MKSVNSARVFVGVLALINVHAPTDCCSRPPCRQSSAAASPRLRLDRSKEKEAPEAGECSHSTGDGGGAGVGSTSPRLLVRMVSVLKAGVRSRGSERWCGVDVDVDIVIECVW